MQTTRRIRRLMFAAAVYAIGGTLAAQEPLTALPAVALPPIPMGFGTPAPPAEAPPLDKPVVEPVAFFPTQATKPSAPAVNAPTPNSVAPQRPAQYTSAPMAAPGGQSWRWYGYGAINGTTLANPAPVASRIDVPTGWATVPAPSAEPPKVANIGVPEKSIEPQLNAPQLPTGPVIDGPAMPKPVLETPVPATPNLPLPKPIAAPPVEPWSGTPTSKAPTIKSQLAANSWKPAIARGSSQR